MIELNQLKITDIDDKNKLPLSFSLFDGNLILRGSNWWITTRKKKLHL